MLIKFQLLNMKARTNQELPFVTYSNRQFEDIPQQILKYKATSSDPFFEILRWNLDVKIKIDYILDIFCRKRRLRLGKGDFVWLQPRISICKKIRD